MIVAVWISTLVLAVAAIVLAAFASRPGKHWLVAPSALPVIIAIALWAAGAAPPHPILGSFLVVVFLLLGVIAGSPAVGLVLRLATRGTVSLGSHGGILVRDASSPAPDREILRGGATIGYLERLALIGAVLAGQPAAVALIVAIKGLGRFSELENEQARERFIIGTLASLIWAGACVAAIGLRW